MISIIVLNSLVLGILPWHDSGKRLVLNLKGKHGLESLYQNYSELYEIQNMSAQAKQDNDYFWFISYASSLLPLCSFQGSMINHPQNVGTEGVS